MRGEIWHKTRKILAAGRMCSALFGYCYRELAVTACMTAWALLGNYAYNGQSEGYDHFFNWFFVVRDPFYAIPEAVAPFVMPFLNLALFFAVEMIIHLIFWGFGGRRTTKRT